MGINIFSGARRIAAVVALLGAVFAVTLAFEREPKGEVSYEIAYPGAQPTPVSECRDNYDDAVETMERTTPWGSTYSVKLCFHSMRANDNRMLIPYEAEEVTSSFWMNSKYHQDVQKYIANVALNFPQPKDEISRASESLSVAKWQRWRNAIGATLAWLVGFWIFVAIIGWIARGFAGIPRGMDRRPEK